MTLTNSKHFFVSLDNYARCDTWKSLLDPPIKSIQLNQSAASFTVEVIKVNGNTVVWYYDTLEEASEHQTRFLHGLDEQMNLFENEVSGVVHEESFEHIGVN